MDNLNISLAEVSDCAAKIRTNNQSMFDELTQIKQDMDNTEAAWMSDAGESIRVRFAQFALRFEKQKEIIDSYAAFLDMTVNSYDTLETTINANATGMQV